MKQKHKQLLRNLDWNEMPSAKKFLSKQLQANDLEEQECNKCHFTQPLNAFPFQKKTCKICIKDRYLRQKFNISIEDYNEMAESQNWACYICGLIPEPSKFGSHGVLNVDHNHVTGSVRKLLCFGCNSLIGVAREDIQILTNAIKYIEEHT